MNLSKSVRHHLESTALALSYPKLASGCVLRGLKLRPVIALERLNQMGLFAGVTHLIDAGAHVGDFTRNALYVLPGIQAVCFEPSPQVFEVLKSRCVGLNTELYQIALGSTKSVANLKLSAVERASSLMQTATAHLEAWPDSATINEVEVPVSRLDDVLRDRPADERYFLKADVQGYELEVLKGAHGIMPRIALIQLEVSFVPLFSGAPKVTEVIDHLEKLGFVLCDTSEVLVSPKSGIPLQADFVFRRTHT